ncbi:MAG TPA: FAD-dependent oxidoreductase [Ignavibacteria bacterium]|nr:FAD-dependent oxidoreductase [Ignavibacteria bacterium]
MNRIDKHPVLNTTQDRKKVNFKFNGETQRGYENEPVSSALIANGVREFSVHQVEDAPQGIFCANGQCSHCTLIIDGKPLKSCITPLKEGMEIRTLIHLPELPPDDREPENFKPLNLKCDVLVIGGGPSGLTSAIELAKLGFEIILIDDKDKLGGKLLLQTHKFFGSIEDCYAGKRGIEIAALLEKEIRTYSNIKVFTNTSVAALYKDKKAGLFIDYKNYALVDFQGLVISAGAREKNLVFPGNDIPGVYGAGAFQTLVNRDLVKSSDRIFIIGSGNVGLIAAYHALQAGITVVGIADILDDVTGYKVHADKIKRMGVPIYLKHTVLTAEGNGKVERITIAEVDDSFNPLLEKAKTFEVDTLLIAVGLSSIDEFYNTAVNFGYNTVKTGDADEIAEASSAMFGGRIAGLQLAKILGKDVEIDESWFAKAEILKSKPGKIKSEPVVEINENYTPIMHCYQEIPCNPCISVCPSGSIKLEEALGNIMDLPYYTGEECTRCGMCIAVCPGLAISVAKKLYGEWAEVVLPHEFIPAFGVGEFVTLTDTEGNEIEKCEVIKIQLNKKYKTYLITFKVSLENAAKIAGIRVQDEDKIKPLPKPVFNYIPDNSILCRCERVSVGEIIKFIKENNIKDANQLKQIRVGMGACGSRTCSILLPRIFSAAGVNWYEVTQATKRPLSIEIPMGAIINEESGETE